MAVSIDVVQAGTGGNNQASFSYTHTASGTPTAMGIGYTGYSGSASGRTMTCTVGGTTAAVEVVTAGDPFAAGMTPTIFGISSASQALTGARTVVVDSAWDQMYGIPYSVTVTGSGTSQVFSNHSSATGTSTTASTASTTCTTASDEILMDAICTTGTGGVTVGANQTVRADFFTSLLTPSDGSTQNGSDGGVMSWSITGSTTEWNIVAASFKAAPGIAFDASSNSGYQAASSGYTWSHTCTGSNRYLTVGVSLLSIVQTVTGITYNSVAMTFLGAQNSITGAARTEMWGLIAPTTGANTISLSLSGSIASAGNASSYTGVHQTFPAEAWNSAFATNSIAADAPVNVTTVADNDWTVDIIATDDVAITVGTGQTQTGNVTGAGGSGAMSYKGPKTPAGSTTMYWTGVDAAQTWTIGSIALRPVAADGNFMAKAYKYFVAAIRGSY